MKSIYVMEHISPRERRSMHRWFIISSVIIVLTIISLVIISINQLLTLRTLQKDSHQLTQASSQLQECLTEKRKLKEQEAFLKGQNAKITRIREKPKNPAQLLELLMHATASGILYDNIEQKKKQLHVILFAPNTDAVLTYIKQLTAHPSFKNIELQSIESSDKQVKATFDATLS